MNKLRAGRTGFDSLQDPSVSFIDLVSTHLIFDGYCGENRPRGDVDYLPASIAKIKNMWNYNSTPSLRSHGVYMYYFAFTLAVRTVSRFTVVGPKVYFKIVCFVGSVKNTPSASHLKITPFVYQYSVYCTGHD